MNRKIKPSRFIFIFLAGIFTILLAACNSRNDQEISTCKDVENLVDRGMCIQEIALTQESENAALGVCEKIDSGVRNTCTRNVAVKFDNKPLCFDNPNEVETYICLTNLAEKKKDRKICEEIARPSDQNLCYRKVAVATLDEAVCENVTEDESFKQNCKDAVTYTRSMQPTDAVTP